MESLDREFVECRRTVEKHRILIDNLLEALPDHIVTIFDHFFGLLKSRRIAFFFQFGHEVWFEKLQCHQFRQTTLIHAKIRTYNDDGTSRKVDTFPKEVLAKTSLFPFDDLTQRLQRSFIGTLDGIATAAVIDESIHGFLEHTLFVAHDNIGRIQIHEAFETLVAVYDAAIKVVHVTNGKFPSIECHEWTEIRWQYRNDCKHHPFGSITTCDKTLDYFEAFDDGFALCF